MIPQINNKTLKRLLTGSLFIVFFLYFAIFNRYHVQYLEQIQLFRWNLDFIKEQFSMPGGLPIYIGSFFTQFFVFSWMGAIILTLNAFTIFVLSYYIYTKHNFKNIVLSLVPVWLLAILQSNELFTFNQSFGFLLLLSFFALYISISKSSLRYIFFFAGWPVFYLLAGGFSIPVVLLCAIHELLFRKQKSHYIITILYIITGVLIPYVASQLIFYIQGNKIFTYPIFPGLHSWWLYSFILLFVWTPLVLLVSFFLNLLSSFKERSLSWNLTNILASILVIALMGFAVHKYAYDKKADMVLGMDHYVQKAEWDKVLKLSDQYPGFNTLVIYYTDLALYKTGQLSDKMFSYPQIGSKGLRLKWERNLNLFFGGEVFYYLSYNNEAFHWAFEAMVAKGLNPRSLKTLVVTSIVNENYTIARKYINLLNQTLYYRKWAQRYNACLSDPASAENDIDIFRMRSLMVNSNFFSEVDGMNLKDLLSNHPENKMAYEYFMASLLLEKNIDAFAVYLTRLNEYGYKSIPLNFEEALIFYNFYEKKDLIPEGFIIRPETIDRFNNYAVIYSKYRNNRAKAARELKPEYGKTYWYYLQFINN